jgi:hypothetical protein
MENSGLHSVAALFTYEPAIFKGEHYAELKTRQAVATTNHHL